MVDNILTIVSSSGTDSNNNEERKHFLTTIEEMLMNRGEDLFLIPGT